MNAGSSVSQILGFQPRGIGNTTSGIQRRNPAIPKIPVSCKQFFFAQISSARNQFDTVAVLYALRDLCGDLW